MAAYLEKENVKLSSFSVASIEVIPRSKNLNTDALAKLASTRDAYLLDAISVEFLVEPSIFPQQGIIEITQESSWINPIVAYLKTGGEPEDKTKARILWRKAACYVLYDDKLYKRGYSISLLKCATLSEAEYIMRKIHEGTCKNHAGGQSLAFKAQRQGYYQPIMKVDCMECARKCEKCQWFSPISKAYPKELTSMTSPWPFAVWGIDLIGRLPKGKGSVQYTVVTIDYFTKWVEAEALASITPSKIKEFVYKNTVCQYGVPYTIISDNSTQFNCDEFKEFCDDLHIKKVFSSIAQPQANGQ